MSSSQAPSSATPSFQEIFKKGLELYRETGEDLIAHPLTAEIKACDSPHAVLTVLEGKAKELNNPKSDKRLSKWLNPTVNILNVLSATLGEAAGSVFPPTKIIFSAIGILLVAAKDTVDSHEALIELFDRIQDFFERLKAYTEAPPAPEWTDALAKTMAEVLSILAFATKRMKEKRGKTFLKNVAGMDGLKDVLQRFDKLERKELLMAIAQVSRDVKQISGIVSRMDPREFSLRLDPVTNSREISLIDIMEVVLQKLKPWLSSPDPSTNYNNGLRELHEETAKWFLEGDVFQKWRSTGSLLWIHGKPGSGKSILCSATIQRILSLCDGGRASVAYFYFDFRDDNKKHRHNLLPSLLVQLAAHSILCCEIISHVYLAHGRGTRQPSDQVLIDCLTNVLSAMTQHPTYIIVDALDECPNTSGVRSPQERVLSLIKVLVDLHLPSLHICVTSRPEIDIRNRLEPLTSLRISLHDQTGQKEDIAKYISSEVDFIADAKKWRKGDKELVIKTLSEKVDGMFRWVFCQLEMLRLCLRSKVRHFVNELPDSLDETYEHILKQIHKTNRSYVRCLLQCLAASFRPLRVAELAGIVAFDFDVTSGEVPTFDADWGSEDQEQELLSACPSLITIVGGHGRRVVQFSHFSVKEFLTSDRLGTSSEDISRYRILPDDAHTTLAGASLGVLLHLDDRVDKWDAKSIPPAMYAAKYWVSHTQVGSGSSRVVGLMKTLFDSDKPHFATWLRIYDESTRWNTPKPVYYSAFLGLYDLVEHLVKKQPEHVNAVGGKYDYPLVAALHEGHFRVAELLFQHGANVDIQGKKGQTPLRRAIEWPDNLAIDAVQFLLKHGADVNSRQEDHTTPLHLVSGNLRPRFVRFLVEHGANVNAKNKQGRTPLHEAFQSYDGNSEDRLSVVQLLIEHGADVDAQYKDHTTPLHLVSGNLRPRFVRLLVEHGANVNAKNKQGRTPLHKAFQSYRGNSEDRFSVVRLLIERGADVDVQYKDHTTPLHLVSGDLHLRLVRLLVEHGANVNAKNKQGRTPLHEAFRSYDGNNEDRFSVVQLLIEHGADVDAQNENHTTPLHLACDKLHLKSVRSLVEHGANVNAKNKQGHTPLYQALLSVHDPDDRFGVARLLLEHGADAEARDEDHDTPLHFISYYSELELVRLLLDHAANVNAKNKQGQTPLHQALLSDCSSEDSFSIARLLLERGADVNAKDEVHRTPLHVASYYSALELVRLLLDHGANITAKNKQGQTPLHQVLLSEHNSEDCFGVARLLVERGADVNARDGACETPLHLASHFLDLKLVQMLLDHGANPNAEDVRGRTPLCRVLEDEACFDGVDFRVAQLLMVHGADANRRDDDHETPLHRASRLVSLELAWILLKHGADLDAENREGKTPFQLVQERVRNEMNRSPSNYSMRRAMRAQGVVLMGLVYGYWYQ